MTSDSGWSRDNSTHLTLTLTLAVYGMQHFAIALHWRPIPTIIHPSRKTLFARIGILLLFDLTFLILCK
ncbi:hypothetical protein J6590_091299, partial [Homalodisca vitripennis]